MSTQALHPKPAHGAIAREQLRAVGLAIRPELLFFAAALLLFTALLLWNEVRMERRMSFDLLPQVALPLLFLAFLVPMSVWKDEGPGRRTYHLSMPVERGWHQLAKSTSGWLWLMGAIAVYLLWAGLLAALTGGDIGVERRGVAVHFEGPRLSREEFRALAEPYRSVLVVIPWWQWAVPFVGATAAYLLGSIVVLSTDQPWRWFVGIVLGFFLTLAVLEMAGLRDLKNAVEAVLDGRYGLETLFTGETRQRWSETTAGGRTVNLSTDRPDLGVWLGTVALWMAVAVGGTLFAAARHREP